MTICSETFCSDTIEPVAEFSTLPAPERLNGPLAIPNATCYTFARSASRVASPELAYFL
jgi:hypothetical protein